MSSAITYKYYHKISADTGRLVTMDEFIAANKINSETYIIVSMGHPHFQKLHSDEHNGRLSGYRVFETVDAPDWLRCYFFGRCDGAMQAIERSRHPRQW